MNTKVTKETTKTVQTLDEARELINESFDKLGLKSMSLFVWSGEGSGIQVKIAQEFDEPSTTD